jgi:putative NADH-flavin reductase
MKVLVIGATGRTGAHIVMKLLARGDEVTAFARKPEEITEKHARLRIAQGDARDAMSIERAVAGQDAVAVAFGPRAMKRDDLQETLMRNLVAAMTKAGVKRLVNLGAMGSGASRAEMPFLYRAIVIPLFFKALFDDKEKGEAIMRASGLDYVNVLPGRLSDAPAKGRVKARLSTKGLRLSMTREDLADFMVAELIGTQWLRKSVYIGY